MLISKQHGGSMYSGVNNENLPFLWQGSKLDQQSVCLTVLTPYRTHRGMAYQSGKY